MLSMGLSDNDCQGHRLQVQIMSHNLTAHSSCSEISVKEAVQLCFGLGFFPPRVPQEEQRQSRHCC